MNCKRCGRNVPIHSKVCPSCGLDNPNWQPRTESTYTPPSRQATHTQRSQSTNASYGQSSSQKTSATGYASTSEKKLSWKPILIVAAVVILIVILANQCSGANRLKGTWVMEDDSGAITFVDKESGYLTLYSSMSSENTKDFTYYVDGDELELKTETSLYSYADVMRFRFEISGDTLTLTEIESGESIDFIKK